MKKLWAWLICVANECTIIRRQHSAMLSSGYKLDNRLLELTVNLTISCYFQTPVSWILSVCWDHTMSWNTLSVSSSSFFLLLLFPDRNNIILFTVLYRFIVFRQLSVTSLGLREIIAVFMKAMRWEGWAIESLSGKFIRKISGPPMKDLTCCNWHSSVHPKLHSSDRTHSCRQGPLT